MAKGLKGLDCGQLKGAVNRASVFFPSAGGDARGGSARNRFDHAKPEIGAKSDMLRQLIQSRFRLAGVCRLICLFLFFGGCMKRRGFFGCF